MISLRSCQLKRRRTLGKGFSQAITGEPLKSKSRRFSEWLAGVFFNCLLLSKVVRLIDNLTTGVLENRKGLVGVPHREKGIPALIHKAN